MYPKFQKPNVSFRKFFKNFFTTIKTVSQYFTNNNISKIDESIVLTLAGYLSR